MVVIDFNKTLTTKGNDISRLKIRKRNSGGSENGRRRKKERKNYQAIDKQ
jgi:hypothetical protein